MGENIESQERNSFRERQKQQLQRELLESALQLFEAKGLDATSVDDIAAKAGVAKGTVYLYFKSKSEIIAAALDEEITKLEQIISSAVANSSQEAPDMLRTAIYAQVTFLRERPGLVLTLLTKDSFASGEPTPETSALKERFESATIAVYERIIRIGMLQRHYREVDAQLAAIVLEGILTALLKHKGKGEISVDDICESAVGIFEQGIKHGA